MSDREMALRFCAFRHFSSDEYSQATSLDAFLLEYTRRIDRAADSSNESRNLLELEEGSSAQW